VVSEQLGLIAEEEAEDRNADLVGFAFEGITVEGSAPWNDAYVLVSSPQGPSCRPAALVRARKLSG